MEKNLEDRIGKGIIFGIIFTVATITGYLSYNSKVLTNLSKSIFSKSYVAKTVQISAGASMGSFAAGTCIVGACTLIGKYQKD